MARQPAEAEETLCLLRNALDGDRKAFDQLFARYRAYLHQVVELRLDANLRRRVDASDVVQEAQLEAARRLAHYLDRPHIPFRLWLRQIAYDRVLMMRRRHMQTKRRSMEQELPLPERSSVQLARQLLAGGTTPTQHVVRSELGQRVRLAVAKLPEGDREILLMRNFEGLSNQDVAGVLGIEPAAASKRYGRALLRLRTCLAGSGLTESES